MNGVLMNYINGQRLDVKSETRIPVYNPARGTLLSEIPDTSADQVDQAVQAAKAAQAGWGKLPAIQRAARHGAIAASSCSSVRGSARFQPREFRRRGP